MSQLEDYILNNDINANNKRILNLPQATSNTEPIRKQEFDAEIQARINGDNNSISMSQTYTDNKIAQLVNSAPDTLILCKKLLKLLEMIQILLQQY
jgi:hypothetical protein